MFGPRVFVITGMKYEYEKLSENDQDVIFEEERDYYIKKSAINKTLN